MKLHPGLFFILEFFLVQNLTAQKPFDQQWPQFRGPGARGYIENTKPPLTWNADSMKNIRWKTPIPGLGHSCPVIWDNFIFVTTAVSEKEEYLKVGLYGDIDMASDSGMMEFKLYCVDKQTGKIVWERTAHKGIPKSRRHTKSTQANSTPATDGKYLVAHFGSEGIYCYDLKGNLIWKKDMGILNPGPYTDPGVEWGYASSPVIYRDKIFVQCDIPQKPFITALDLATGNEIWRTSRDDEVSTWCTPAICTENGKTQVIANGYRNICGYDAETGNEIWRLSNGGDAPAPTPVIANHLIYLNSAHGRYSPIFAVKPDAVGNITLSPDSTRNKYIVWSIKRGGAYMQTPLIFGDYLYNLQVNGALTCYHALTGQVMYKENLVGAFSASGVAAEDRLYFTSEEGSIYVVKAGPEFKLLAVNALNDICMATPALSENSIYFRTRHFLIAVRK
jgi:outer membrane protein assembly factor BamB